MSPSTLPNPSQCPSCLHKLSTTQYFPPREDAYGRCDIICLVESPHTVVYDILRQSRARHYSDNASQLSATSTRTGCTDAAGQGRPAIVASRVNMKTTSGETQNGIKAFLMATFNKTTEVADLPQVLQYFTVPVSPHGAVATNVGTPHVHTLPEWQGVQSLLLIWPINSLGHIVGRWDYMVGDQRVEGSTFKVNVDTLLWLVTSRNERWHEWRTRCAQTKGYLKYCEQEYKVGRYLVCIRSLCSRNLDQLRSSVCGLKESLLQIRSVVFTLPSRGRGCKTNHPHRIRDITTCNRRGVQRIVYLARAYLRLLVLQAPIAEYPHPQLQRASQASLDLDHVSPAEIGLSYWQNLR